MAITRTAQVDDDGSGTTGTVWNNAWKTELYGQIDDAIGSPRCVAYHATTEALTADGALALNSEDLDVGGPMHDTATNNSRLTVPAGKAGFYRVTAQIHIDTEGTGDANPSIRLNGSTKLKETKIDATISVPATTTTLIWEGDLVAGDYVEIVIDKSDGSSWTYGSSSRFRATTLSAVRCG